MTIAIDRPGAVGFGRIRTVAVGVSAEPRTSYWRFGIDVHAQEL